MNMNSENNRDLFCNQVKKNQRNQRNSNYEPHILWPKNSEDHKLNHTKSSNFCDENQRTSPKLLINDQEFGDFSQNLNTKSETERQTKSFTNNFKNFNETSEVTRSNFRKEYWNKQYTSNDDIARKQSKNKKHLQRNFHSDFNLQDIELHTNTFNRYGSSGMNLNFGEQLGDRLGGVSASSDRRRANTADSSQAQDDNQMPVTFGQSKSGFLEVEEKLPFNQKNRRLSQLLIPKDQKRFTLAESCFSKLQNCCPHQGENIKASPK